MLTRMWLYQWLFVFSYTRARQLYKSTEFKPDTSLSLQTVKVTTSVRSKLECMSLCTSEPSCTAVRYLNSGTKMCYFLDRANSFAKSQSGINWVVYQVTKENTECRTVNGLLEPATLPDSAYTASTYYTSRFQGDNPPHWAHFGNTKSWCSAKSAPQEGEWIQVDLGKMYQIPKIGIQGTEHSFGNHYYVTQYQLWYSVDGAVWDTYKDGDGNTKILQGNTNADRYSLILSNIDYIIEARYVRYYVVAWANGGPGPTDTVCIRIEIYGCDPSA